MKRSEAGHLSDGDLLGCLDGQPGDPGVSIEAHLEGCPDCRARLDDLRAGAGRVSAQLGLLAPGPLEGPDRRRALAALRLAVEEKEASGMFERIRNSRQARRALAGIGALVVLMGLLALPPVRALASDFLSLFRVQSFVVVDVDSERIEQIAQALEENLFFGEEQMMEPPAEPVEVASLDEAAALAGFRPRAPRSLGEPTSIQVGGAQQVRFTPDFDALRAVFGTMGLDPALLPEGIDGQPFDISIPASVVQHYNSGDPDEESGFTIFQIPAPTVEVPEGVDVQALGEAMLQLLGMSPQEAARLSSSIDWTTTLVLPVPTDMASVQEVSVDGTTGLLFEAGSYQDVDGAGGALLWQKDGIVTMVTCGGSSITLLGVAQELE